MVREANNPRSRRTPRTPAPASAPNGISTISQSQLHLLAFQLPASHFMFLMDHCALRTLVLRAPERCAQRHSNRNTNAQPNRDVPSQNPRDRAQRRSQRNAQSSMFRFAHSSTPTSARAGTGALGRPAERSVGGLTSPHPPPEASPPCPQSAAPCPATPQAACPRASQTAPEPAPPSSRCQQ
jgi:hypothetical protein